MFSMSFAVTLGAQTGDGISCTGAGVKDQLHITLTNDSGPGNIAWDVTIHGVSYTVGSGYTATGGVPNSSVTSAPPWAAFYLAGYTGATPVQLTVAANATVANYKVTANNPPVGLQPGSTNQAISNVVVTEYAAHVVGATTYTTTSDGSTFSNTSHPTFSVTGGGAVVNPTVTVSGGELSFQVLVASTTGPAVYTLSGLVVNAGSNPQAVYATINSLPAPNPGVIIYSVIGSSRIQGQVATDTSANLFQSNGCNDTAVLATSDNYPDALSAAYLASNYNYDTSVIITPTAAVALATLNALRFEGVQTVLVVGGPLAISPADIATLRSTQSYECGGTVPRTQWLTGFPQMLSVTQIWGQDQYGTAQQVAQYVAASNIGTVMTPGAYGGTYNDTTGANGTAATSAPTRCVPTAILATGVNFPDAMAASATSWENGLPILLTEKGSLAPEASAAILNLGIQQVIVMGGPDAISDNVLTQLEAMGVTVFRIAGHDMTDTAQLLAQFELNYRNTSNVRNGLEWSTNQDVGLTVTRGDNWQDALSASAFAGGNESPMLVTFDPNTVGPYLTGFLNAAGAGPGVGTDNLQNFFELTILGGPYAIAPATLATMMNDLAV